MAKVLGEIEIDDIWTLRAEEWQWTVIEKIPVDKDHHFAKKNGGKEYNTRETYYSTLIQACAYILDQDSKVSEDVDDILDCMEDCTDAIIYAIKKYAKKFPRSGIRKKKKKAKKELPDNIKIAHKKLDKS